MIDHYVNASETLRTLLRTASVPSIKSIGMNVPILSQMLETFPESAFPLVLRFLMVLSEKGLLSTYLPMRSMEAYVLVISKTSYGLGGGS